MSAVYFLLQILKLLSLVFLNKLSYTTRTTTTTTKLDTLNSSVRRPKQVYTTYSSCSYSTSRILASCLPSKASCRLRYAKTNLVQHRRAVSLDAASTLVLAHNIITTTSVCIIVHAVNRRAKVALSRGWRFQLRGLPVVTLPQQGSSC